jgi:hypothetical protein
MKFYTVESLVNLVNSTIKDLQCMAGIIKNLKKHCRKDNKVNLVFSAQA